MANLGGRHAPLRFTKIKITGTEIVLPSRDRERVGAVGSQSWTSVLNGVTMGPRPTKDNQDASWGRQSCLQPPFRRLVSEVSRLKAGCSQDWLPHNISSVFKGA